MSHQTYFTATLRTVSLLSPLSVRGNENFNTRTAAEMAASTWLRKLVLSKANVSRLTPMVSRDQTPNGAQERVLVLDRVVGIEKVPQGLAVTVEAEGHWLDAGAFGRDGKGQMVQMPRQVVGIPWTETFTFTININEVTVPLLDVGDVDDVDCKYFKV